MSFHVVVWQRTATKCTKINNARAPLLFCSLNLLFGDVPVAMVCLSSLLSLYAGYDRAACGAIIVNSPLLTMEQCIGIAVTI